MVSLCSGKKFVLIEYIVVYIILDEKPCRKRVISERLMNHYLSSSLEMRPNEMKELPIRSMPMDTRLRRPQIGIILLTMGLQKMTATE